MWELRKKVGLRELKERYGFKGPPSFVYVNARDDVVCSVGRSNQATMKNEQNVCLMVN